MYSQKSEEKDYELNIVCPRGCIIDVTLVGTGNEDGG